MSQEKLVSEKNGVDLRRGIFFPELVKKATIYVPNDMRVEKRPLISAYDTP